MRRRSAASVVGAAFGLELEEAIVRKLMLLVLMAGALTLWGTTSTVQAQRYSGRGYYGRGYSRPYARSYRAYPRSYYRPYRRAYSRPYRRAYSRPYYYTSPRYYYYGW
jgi:hypothetical protein